MKKEIVRLMTMWEGFDKKQLEYVYSCESPLVTLVILSWMRFGKLLQTLNHFLTTIKIPMNIALRVQGSELLDKNTKDEIIKTVDRFYNKHVSFVKHNHGSGVPRWEMLQIAKEFNTPFIMFTDDDMLFPRGSIEGKISILRGKKKLGAVASWCSPGYSAWNVVGNNLLPRPPRHGLDYVDAMGSATTIMKREVFKKCGLDRKYYVGWGDFDLCMQIRKNGWKSAILALPQLKAINNVAGDPPKYRATRYNKNYGNNSADRFLNKWGIKIGR